ncbi:MAG: hypothetical protein SO031_07775 [Candidatus Ventricola sp.]|nr:hypothetical protein [Candidatus Ventricola sp.]
MAIDLNNIESCRKLTLNDLVKDAVERKDKEALVWLQEQSTTMVNRTKEDGTTYQVNKSIVAIRAEYFKKFLNYKPKGKLSAEQARQRKREKKAKEVADMFADAFAMLDK